MSDPCKHEPFERVMSFTDMAGEQIRFADPVVFLFDVATQLTPTPDPRTSAGYYESMAHAARNVRSKQVRARDSYVVMGCRHCGALFAGPERPARKLVEGDPYRSDP